MGKARGTLRLTVPLPSVKVTALRSRPSAAGERGRPAVALGRLFLGLTSCLGTPFWVLIG